MKNCAVGYWGPRTSYLYGWGESIYAGLGSTCPPWQDPQSEFCANLRSNYYTITSSLASLDTGMDQTFSYSSRRFIDMWRHSPTELLQSLVDLANRSSHNDFHENPAGTS